MIMQSSLRKAIVQDESEIEWILALDNVLKLTDETVRSGLQTRLSCKVVGDQASLILPPEMDELQPDVLQYLHALGAAQDITLIEERRVDDIIPVINLREDRPPDLALGVSLLLKQTGMPGPVHSLSTPHMLHPDNPPIDLAKLIKIVANVYKDAKKVVFVPNRFLTGNFSDKNSPLTGYACKVITGDRKLILSYFNAPEFHAIGYVSNNQFVMHVFLAGGPISNPRLWSPYSIMTDSAFRCQVFKSAVPGHDFGLLYSTFYIDLDHSLQNQDWWSTSSSANPEVSNDSA